MPKKSVYSVQHQFGILRIPLPNLLAEFTTNRGASLIGSEFGKRIRQRNSKYAELVAEMDFYFDIRQS